MTLSVRQAKFVEGVALGKSHAEAARAAGYSPQYARRAAERLPKCKGVQDAIDAMREQIRKDSKLTIERYMEELTEGARQSKEAKQFTAAARYDELRGKLSGFLVERMHLLHEQVDLRAAIEEAKARVLKHEQARHAIDTTFTEVPADPARRLLED